MSTSLTRVVIAIVAMLAALAMPTTAAAAAPANDAFEAATVLSGPAGQVSGTTIGSTAQTNEACLDVYECTVHSVWYRWTAPATSSGSVVFSACDSTFDSIIDVWTGTTVTSVYVAGSNDGCGLGSTASSVTFTPVPGTTYSIRVGGSFTGNFTLSYPAGVGVDDVPPVLTVPTAVYAVATSASGSSVTWTSVTATDAVDGAVTPDCTPGNGSLFPLGMTTVSCTATDSAGNESAPSTFPVYVTYTWSNVLTPLNADGSSIFKRGSTVPVKFRLSGFSAGVTDATARIYVAKYANAVLGEDVEATTTVAATTGNLFRYADGTYVYNLGTKGMSRGTWRARIDLGDGVLRTVDFSLR